MNREELQNELDRKKERMFALEAIMQESDKYAARCQKINKKFSQEYAEKKQEYDEAYEEYQQIEARITEIETLLASQTEEENSISENSPTE